MMAVVAQLYCPIRDNPTALHSFCDPATRATALLHFIRIAYEVLQLSPSMMENVENARVFSSLCGVPALDLHNGSSTSPSSRFLGSAQARNKNTVTAHAALSASASSFDTVARPHSGVLQCAGFAP